MFRPSLIQCSVFAMAMAAWPAMGADIPAGPSGFKSKVAPFFKAHCVACHGPEKSKGKITLHTLDGDLSAGHDPERWELILEMLESGEMPPEKKPQPAAADRKAVAHWITFMETGSERGFCRYQATRR